MRNNETELDRALDSLETAIKNVEKTKVKLRNEFLKDIKKTLIEGEIYKGSLLPFWNFTATAGAQQKLTLELKEIEYENSYSAFTKFMDGPLNVAIKESSKDGKTKFYIDAHRIASGFQTKRPRISIMISELDVKRQKIENLQLKLEMFEEKKKQDTELRQLLEARRKQEKQQRKEKKNMGKIEQYSHRMDLLLEKLSDKEEENKITEKNYKKTIEVALKRNDELAETQKKTLSFLSKTVDHLKNERVKTNKLEKTIVLFSTKNRDMADMLERIAIKGIAGIESSKIWGKIPAIENSPPNVFSEKETSTPEENMIAFMIKLIQCICKSSRDEEEQEVLQKSAIIFAEHSGKAAHRLFITFPTRVGAIISEKTRLEFATLYKHSKILGNPTELTSNMLTLVIKAFPRNKKTNVAEPERNLVKLLDKKMELARDSETSCFMK